MKCYYEWRIHTFFSLILFPLISLWGQENNLEGLVISEVFAVRGESGGGNNELLNLSTRSTLGPGPFVSISNSSIILSGTDPMTVVFRGRSTSISDSITADKISDPVIDVVEVGQGVIATNDNWADAENLDLIEGTSLDPDLVPMGPTESLLILTNLSSGTYSLRAQSKIEGETGLIITEAFALREGDEIEANELLNISTRSFMGTTAFADISNSSIIIGGTDPMTVVFRGRSTSISDSITADKISDPVIDVVEVGQGVIATNDNWADAENLDLLKGTSLDPDLVPMGPTESLLVLTDLAPGSYSVRVRANEPSIEGPQTLSFTQQGTGFVWTLTGNDNPSEATLGDEESFQTISARVGDVLSFSGQVGVQHPWFLRTTEGSDLFQGISGATQGVTGTFTMTWDTAGYEPGTYIYICGNHSFMVGDIVLTN